MKVLNIELNSEKEVSIFKKLIEYLYTTDTSLEESEYITLLELSDRFTVIPLKVTPK